jgi:hypothetical protein
MVDMSAARHIKRVYERSIACCKIVAEHLFELCSVSFGKQYAIYGQLWVATLLYPAYHCHSSRQAVIGKALGRYGNYCPIGCK